VLDFAPGLKIGEDVFVAFSPERIDPGVASMRRLARPAWWAVSCQPALNGRQQCWSTRPARSVRCPPRRRRR